MPSSRMIVMAVLAAGVLLPGPLWAASFVERPYEVFTSTPHGSAVCSFSGRFTEPGDDFTARLEVTVTPAPGQEARLELTLNEEFRGGRYPRTRSTAAGVEESCDIYDPDSASGTVEFPLFGIDWARNFTGSIVLHAHPNNCGIGDLGEGTLSAATVATFVSRGAVSLRLGNCDGNPENANLQPSVSPPPGGGRTGEVHSTDVRVWNPGPGAAKNAWASVKLPRNAFFDGVALTQGHCLRDVRKRAVDCALGDIPEDGEVIVSVDLKPLKPGKHRTKVTVGADNNGEVFSDKATVTTPVEQSSNAILSVEIDCRKGAGGTIAINPNGGGGTTTCTCPDNTQNPPLDDFLCAAETYGAATSVTLTAAPTGTHQFDKWAKSSDCSGQPATCVLNIDPNVKTLYTARGKFKP